MLRGVHLSLRMGMVDPQPVAATLAEALLTAQVTQATDGKSGFSLSFAFGKRSDVRRTFESGGFDPPMRLVMVVIVNGQSNVIMDGVIVKHDVTASNDPGQMRLTLVGEDLSRMLDLVDLSWVMKYPAMPAEARVALILAKYAPLGLVPVVIPSVEIDVPMPTEYIPSHMGTDLQYVNYLAKRVGYVFYVDPGPMPGQSIGYWGPEVKVGDPQPALIVNADAGSNVDQLSFGFDGFAKTVFAYLIHDEKLPVNIAIPIPVPDVNPLSPPLGPRMPVPLRVEPLTGMAKMSIPQAAMVGLAKAARAAEVITGSGTLNVIRYGRVLQPRRLVEVRGASYAYDGLHYVRSVTHQIRAGEYKQSFTLSRNAFNPWSGANAG
jgi:hypothetical protein